MPRRRAPEGIGWDSLPQWIRAFSVADWEGPNIESRKIAWIAAVRIWSAENDLRTLDFALWLRVARNCRRTRTN